MSTSAKELGFAFTAKDMHDHFSKQLGDSNDLNEDDLSSVAGGTVSATSLAAASAVSAVVGTSVVTSTTQGSGW